MGASRFKVQTAVSLQLQRALPSPSQGIRVLFSKTICNLLNNKYIYIYLYLYILYIYIVIIIIIYVLTTNAQS